jgi:hypothetical protein
MKTGFAENIPVSCPFRDKAGKNALIFLALKPQGEHLIGEAALIAKVKDGLSLENIRMIASWEMIQTQKKINFNRSGSHEYKDTTSPFLLTGTGEAVCSFRHPNLKTCTRTVRTVLPNGYTGNRQDLL